MECTPNSCRVHVVTRPRRQELLSLAYASAGYECKEAAEAMGTTMGYIESLLKGARDRLGASNTKHAIALAYAHGVLPIEGVEI